MVRLLPNPGQDSLSISPVTDVSYRREYLALFGSLIFVALEGFIRIITLGLRKLVLT